MRARRLMKVEGGSSRSVQSRRRDRVIEPRTTRAHRIRNSVRLLHGCRLEHDLEE